MLGGVAAGFLRRQTSKPFLVRVLFILHTPRLPNTSVYQEYERRIAYLENAGHEAVVLTPQDFPGIRRCHSRWLPLTYPFSVAWFLLRKGRGYDLVSFHSYAGWVVNLLRRRVPAYRHLKTVTSFQGLEPLYYEALKAETEKTGRHLTLRFRLIHGSLLPQLMRLSCRRSDRVICLNQKEASYLTENRWADSSKIFILPHGASSIFFICREYREKARRLLFVGQWELRKGIRYLVETFCSLAYKDPELELWCVGTMRGPEQVLEAFPEEVHGRIVVHPRVDQQELLTVYQQADLFLFPTLFEGRSTALLEAMAAALPIVTTPTGAAPDLLEQEVNALLVAEADASALTAAVRRLIDDQPLRRRLGQQAQADVREHREECAFKRITDFYLNLLQCPAAA